MTLKQNISTMTMLIPLILHISCESEIITGISTGSLSIIVLDQSLNPISGAEVKIFNENEYTCTTNSSGQCSFSNLSTVNTIVRVKNDGYKRVYDTFTISEGSNSKTFTLEPIEEFTEGFESGVFSGEWTFSGDANWFITSSESHSGTFCARSGSIGDYETCTISLTLDVEVDKMIFSFWYKVSSEYGDLLRFYINGIEQSYYWDEEIPWTQYETTLSEGIYELIWTYEKDYGYTSGEDCVWIDDISLTE